MPLAPVGNDVIDAALINVPDAATLRVQFETQLIALILVARHLMYASDEHPVNIA